MCIRDSFFIGVGFPAYTMPLSSYIRSFLLLSQRRDLFKMFALYSFIPSCICFLFVQGKPCLNENKLLSRQTSRHQFAVNADRCFKVAVIDMNMRLVKMCIRDRGLVDSALYSCSIRFPSGQRGLVQSMLINTIIWTVPIYLC